ncbi:MAG TPA: TIR domain-containing protein, partial [Hyphomicrobiaceae bacterium]|nr:TIR domain-containing protein [Hyphomicrobiaceae bacterium]
MPGKIFVNYRRDDDRSTAARIRDRLATTFGDTSVFMDVDDLRPGERFDLKLAEALAQTDVFLAIIGSRWLELLTERQARGERDYVRAEISGALQRGIVIIPVLIERTPLPHPEALPGDIRELVLHQKHVVTHERFGRDVADLAEAIRLALKVARPGGGGAGLALRWAGAVALAALVLGGGALAYQSVSIRWTSHDDGTQSLLQQEAADKGRQEAKRKAEEEIDRQRHALLKAEEDRKAQEIERQRLAMLKAEQDRRRAEEAERQQLAMLKAADDRRRAEAAEQAERQRLAMLKAEQDRKQAEEIERQRVKAEEDRKRIAEAAAAKTMADEAARAKRAADEAPDRQRLAKLQEEQRQESTSEVDKSASVEKEKTKSDPAKVAALTKGEKLMERRFDGIWTITTGSCDGIGSTRSYSIKVEAGVISGQSSANGSVSPSGVARWAVDGRDYSGIFRDRSG